jgi:hypothetical protein
VRRRIVTTLILTGALLLLAFVLGYRALAAPRLSWVTVVLPLGARSELAVILVPCSATLPQRVWLFYREESTTASPVGRFSTNNHLLTLRLLPRCPRRL